MNEPQRGDWIDAPTIVEYRVINMAGRPATSGTYSTAHLGVDALTDALAIQAARGGEIIFRTITQTPWTPYRFPRQSSS